MYRLAYENTVVCLVQLCKLCWGDSHEMVLQNSCLSSKEGVAVVLMSGWLLHMACHWL